MGPLQSSTNCNSCGRIYTSQEGVWNWLPRTLETAKINENLAQEALSEKFWRRLMNKRHRIEWFEREWLPKIISNQARSFLELGGGLCYASALVKEARPDMTVLATDISPIYLSRHSKRVADVMEVPMDVYAAVDGENLPFADGQVDAIFSQMVLYRVPNPVKMLREIYRVLAPGGRYIGIERASPWITAVSRWKERWMIDRAQRLGIAEKPISYGEWQELLKKAGLDSASLRLLPGRKVKNPSLRYAINAVKVVHIAIELTKRGS